MPAASVKRVYVFPYFPRVTSAQLKSGWAARMEAIQGRRGTYHAGGLLTFWDVEQAMRCGRDIVLRYLLL